MGRNPGHVILGKLMSRKTIWIALIFILCSILLYAEDPVVYVTKTGEKYHTGTCSYYDFKFTATDGQVNGGGGVDKFRIKI